MKAMITAINIFKRPLNNPSKRTISYLLLAPWFIYLVTSPFYIFPKGRPQPADFILILTMAPFLVTQFLHYRPKIKPIFMIGSLFVALTIVINAANYLFFPDIRFILTALIYPYNFAIFLFAIILFRQDPETFKKTTYLALIVAIILQLIIVLNFDFGYRGYRATGGFENPNQFAYWSILTATMIIFLKRGKKLNLFDLSLLGLLGYFQTLALSKAGLIAYAILIALLFITPKIPKSGYLLLLIGIIGAGIISLNNPGKIGRIIGNIDAIQNATARIEGIGQEADDSPEARGYYRIVENPLYTLVGSGEGAFWRFNAEGYNRELHSGIATIIFSYGIFGAALFFGFLLLAMNKQPWFYILLFAPIILFGLPHQNFRFAHFWVLLGINYGLATVVREEQYHPNEISNDPASNPA